MRDVEGDAQINIIDRGYGSEIATFQEEGVHSLMSGNLMDVCPVGAITTRDYRFKSRPWDNPEAVDTTEHWPAEPGRSSSTTGVPRSRIRRSSIPSKPPGPACRRSTTSKARSVPIRRRSACWSMESEDG